MGRHERCDGVLLGVFFLFILFLMNLTWWKWKWTLGKIALRVCCMNSGSTWSRKINKKKDAPSCALTLSFSKSKCIFSSHAVPRERLRPPATVVCLIFPLLFSPLLVSWLTICRHQLGIFNWEQVFLHSVDNCCRVVPAKSHMIEPFTISILSTNNRKIAPRLSTQLRPPTVRNSYTPRPHPQSRGVWGRNDCSFS